MSRIDAFRARDRERIGWEVVSIVPGWEVHSLSTRDGYFQLVHDNFIVCASCRKDSEGYYCATCRFDQCHHCNFECDECVECQVGD